jgi:hypothetical protein
MVLLGTVSYDLPFDKIHDLLGNVRGVVGDSLHVPGG